MKYIIISIAYIVRMLFVLIFFLTVGIVGLLVFIWDFRRITWGDVFYKKVQRFDGQYAHINRGFYYEHIPDKNWKETLKRWRNKG